VFLSHVFAQFDVPVGEVDEMFPAIVFLEAEVDLHEWAPLRPLRLANQVDTGFLRCAIGFARIALDAGANNVLPGGRAAAVARNDVIEIQILSIERLAAVLAHIFVALENVMPGELDFFLWQVVIDHQQNDARNADAERDGSDGFGMRFLLRKIMPFAETVGLERAVGAVENRLGVALKKQGEGATSGADIYRLPQPVQDQHMLVEYRTHD
jgi:hypothetical protein